MKIYMIAGEVSGDKHGAFLMNAFKACKPDIDFKFTGGQQMEIAAGKKPLIPVEEMAVMGFFQLISKLFSISRWLKKVQNDIQDYKPDVLILIDYPGFNLRMAKWAKSRGIKVVYYISPKIWAWNESRIKVIKKCVDRMYCILPFEKEFYAKHGYEVSYFGNPLLDEVKAFKPHQDFLKIHSINRPVIALLPGSRAQEIKKMLPVMAETIRAFPHYDVLIPRSSNLDSFLLWRYIPADLHSRIVVLDNAYYDILSVAKLALVTSGTATLETALFDVPQVVCYKTGSLTYQLAKRLIKVPYISLVNLIADQPLVAECIQEKCHPHVLEEELKKLEAMSAEGKLQFYAPLKSKMGDPGSTDKVARSIIQWLH